ncbi:hypothetical protein CEXT_600101 [Caerostris extrusa]|uniref:Uncharacterized protein n=1 Tax=Caerostris extrusa TaxID=172846 RepID=A0AAV4RG73_CAEEX|nr:hypothetical protein CEXT_600101 [Caerostris extrusa]
MDRSARWGVLRWRVGQKFLRGGGIWKDIRWQIEFPGATQISANMKSGDWHEMTPKYKSVISERRSFEVFVHVANRQWIAPQGVEFCVGVLGNRFLRLGKEESGKDIR